MFVAYLLSKVWKKRIKELFGLASSIVFYKSTKKGERDNQDQEYYIRRNKEELIARREEMSDAGRLWKSINEHKKCRLLSIPQTRAAAPDGIPRGGASYAIGEKPSSQKEESGGNRQAKGDAHQLVR